MKRKVAIFAYNGEPMCFAHVLLNTLDMKKRGYEIKLVVEGTATKQLKELTDPARPFANLYERVRDSGLIDCVCQACANKTGSLQSVKEQGLQICGEMSGHPSISRYMDGGYEVLVF